MRSGNRWGVFTRWLLLMALAACSFPGLVEANRRQTAPEGSTKPRQEEITQKWEVKKGNVDFFACVDGNGDGFCSSSVLDEPLSGVEVGVAGYSPQVVTGPDGTAQAKTAMYSDGFYCRLPHIYIPSTAGSRDGSVNLTGLMFQCGGYRPDEAGVVHLTYNNPRLPLSEEQQGGGGREAKG